MNQGANLTAGLQGNADQMRTQETNLQAALQAALANQGADQQSAGLRLDAGSRLGQLGLEGDSNQRANLELMNGLGADERAIMQSLDPGTQELILKAAQAGLLGAMPDRFDGSTVTGSGVRNTNETTTERGSTLDSLGKILSLFQTGAKIAGGMG